MPVGIVVVSHSAELARGVVELAAQMAPEVAVRAAGGTAEGGLGTDLDAVQAAVGEADDGSGAVLLYDLGSARMVAEMVLETADDPDRLRLADAPLVEGAVAAAVSAQGGADVDAVAAAAHGVDATSGDDTQEAQAPGDEAAYRYELELTNEVGLHARPAAMLTRCLQGLDTRVTVRHGTREADAASVLALMSLDARQGDTVELLASGPDAEQALRRVQELADRGFEG